MAISPPPHPGDGVSAKTVPLYSVHKRITSDPVVVAQEGEETEPRAHVPHSGHWGAT
jgi:hypothetical protein